MFALKWANGPYKLVRFPSLDLCITGYWQYSLNALPSSDCGLMFHAPRGHILSFLFCAVLSSLSMAKAAVAIPPDVLEAARPAAIPLPEHPPSGESPILPTEEVVCFLSLFLWCAALSICWVCYAELRPAMVVLVTYITFSVAFAVFVFSLVSFCGE